MASSDFDKNPGHTDGSKQHCNMLREKEKPVLPNADMELVELRREIVQIKDELLDQGIQCSFKSAGGMHSGQDIFFTCSATSDRTKVHETEEDINVCHSASLMRSLRTKLERYYSLEDFILQHPYGGSELEREKVNAEEKKEVKEQADSLCPFTAGAAGYADTDTEPRKRSVFFIGDSEIESEEAGDEYSESDCELSPDSGMLALWSRKGLMQVCGERVVPFPSEDYDFKFELHEVEEETNTDVNKYETKSKSSCAVL